MITFLAFHGDPQRKAEALAAVAAFTPNGTPPSLVRMLTGGRDDLATAHLASGFPAPLLLLCDALCRRLPIDEAHHFATCVLDDATCDTDLADVAELFLTHHDPDTGAVQALAAKLRAMIRTAPRAPAQI